MSRRARAAALLERSGLGALLRRMPLWRGVVVLGYHRIGDPGSTQLDRGVFSASAEDLDAQVELLARSFDVIALDDLEAAASRRARGRAVMLTFDDGYADQADAARILHAHGVPGTFFLTSGFLDGAGLAWWDEIAWMIRSSRRLRLTANPLWTGREMVFDGPDREGLVRSLLARYRTLAGEDREAFLDWLAESTGSGRAPAERGPWMTWDDARELEGLGHRVGGHTVTHPIFALLDRETQRAEIAGGLERLRAELSGTVDSFAYPSGHPGSFDDATAELLRESGVRWAFSFRGGWQRPGRLEPFDVRRIGVFSDHPTPLVAATVALPYMLGGELRLPEG